MSEFPTGPAIALANRSTVVADDELTPVAAALQRQLEEHFAPNWGFTASVITTPSTDQVPEWAWAIVITDDADQARILGYHDVTATGRPQAKVFARTSAQYGVHWSAMASHELLEMLADPGVNLAAYNWADTDRGSLYAMEVCDPVNAVFYEIDGVRVSNFVYPAWYRVFDPDNDGPYDFLGFCPGPFTLAFGGFQLYVQWGQGGWQFHTAGRVAASATDPPEGSRRERRIRGQQNWQPSEGR